MAVSELDDGLAAGVGLPDHRERTRIRHRRRTKQHGVHRAENGAVGADGQGQRDDRSRRVPGRVTQVPNGQPQIVDKSHRVTPRRAGRRARGAEMGPRACKRKYTLCPSHGRAASGLLTALTQFVTQDEPTVTRTLSVNASPQVEQSITHAGGDGVSRRRCAVWHLTCIGRSVGRVQAATWAWGSVATSMAWSGRLDTSWEP